MCLYDEVAAGGSERETASEVTTAGRGGMVQVRDAAGAADSFRRPRPVPGAQVRARLDQLTRPLVDVRRAPARPVARGTGNGEAFPAG